MGVEQGREGRACSCATVWTLSCLEAGGFVGSVRVREQHVRVRSVRDWAVCAHVVLWAAALCACALFAWVACMWAVLMGMHCREPCRTVSPRHVPRRMTASLG